MTTTSIIAVIVNIILSVVCYIGCMREIKESPLMTSYYEAQGTAGKILSWVSSIVTGLISYGLILFGEGFWNTFGWVVYWIDIISMISLTVLMKFIGWKLAGK